MTWRVTLIAFFIISYAYFSHADNSEEPIRPVCRMVRKNSLPFCSMVDYEAVLDENDRDGLLFDAKARMYYDNANVVLQRFGCHIKYSLYNCDDCREAYKYWICSIKFQRCGSSTATSDSHPLLHHTICRPSSNGDQTCIEGISGRFRTCLSLCEDVVRKCPYVLNFQCPTTETVFFSTDITTCNKLDRESNPDRPGLPWPGTFAYV